MGINSELIIFAGRTGSGKTSISKAFAEANGLRWTSFGNAVRAEAARVGLSHKDKGILQQLGQNLVDNDPDKLCKAVLKPLEVGGAIIGVLDGLRHEKILDLLIESAGAHSIRLVFVEVDQATRYNRLISNRNWTATQCELYDNDPTEWELDRHLKARADLIIDNAGDLECSLAQIGSLLRRVC